MYEIRWHLELIYYSRFMLICCIVGFKFDLFNGSFVNFLEDRAMTQFGTPDLQC